VFLRGPRLRIAHLPEPLRATAARMSALNALASIASLSRMSMARRVLPSRLELNSLAGSFNEAPLKKVSFTVDRYDSPVQMPPSWHQTGVPFHFHSPVSELGNPGADAPGRRHPGYLRPAFHGTARSHSSTTFHVRGLILKPREDDPGLPDRIAVDSRELSEVIRPCDLGIHGPFNGRMVARNRGSAPRSLLPLRVSTRSRDRRLQGFVPASMTPTSR
jgi:hypothetical protein